MKKLTCLLLTASLLPTVAPAWNTPGQNFSGELNLAGIVTSTRNPWEWQLSERSEDLDVKTLASRGHEQVITVAIPALKILLGKTTRSTPTGREGLVPRVIFGRGAEGFSLTWEEPGIAQVILPVTGEGNLQAGLFSFRMTAAALLRNSSGGQAVVAGVYDDLKGNGLPEQALVVGPEQTGRLLSTMFAGDGPAWLQGAAASDTIGLSQFANAELRQIDGVYGAQVVAGSGELRLKGELPRHWHVSLPVSIEYQ
ncbi:K88 minor fimbrial subunit FaeI [Erwinia pyrifoliae]|uniref:Fimbrial protein n=1 Tax=Erwinia pyrifoliae TaxID=79967 RepID=A0ABY5X940_ERWPY|nr:K88 minor fimbrial subunit FaeI [Erwinia pyrifoliae]AUX74125.1 fimbrial protein [Erwinia pyrifoliae]MCA8875528.1 fimbrial protein [Erwinia pyrifoliae]MCT2385180.1 fimbrial protein [Erwinia pyrifoliae]MCU8585596.1 fimbrial protein [Erwinia pyrifoliae]UWS29578.1 fimbrial protein [Erwinia pyrifoliae]